MKKTKNKKPRCSEETDQAGWTGGVVLELTIDSLVASIDLVLET